VCLVWSNESGSSVYCAAMMPKPKVHRTDYLRDDRERNVVRGHALFVRFMERKGLGDCVRYINIVIDI